MLTFEHKTSNSRTEMYNAIKINDFICGSSKKLGLGK